MAATSPATYRPRVSEETRRKLKSEADIESDIDAEELTFEQRLQVVLGANERRRMSGKYG